MCQTAVLYSFELEIILKLSLKLKSVFLKCIHSKTNLQFYIVYDKHQF